MARKSGVKAVIAEDSVDRHMAAFKNPISGTALDWFFLKDKLTYGRTVNSP